MSISQRLVVKVAVKELKDELVTDVAGPGSAVDMFYECGTRAGHGLIMWEQNQFPNGEPAHILHSTCGNDYDVVTFV